MLNDNVDGGLEIVIDVGKFSLELMDEGNVVKRYPVAVGAKKTPTPVGEYKIVHMAHWGGAFGTRWMGLDVPWGTYGIHGTKRPETIGTAVSHGCIRMYNRHVEDLYDKVSIGTKVVILGPIYKEILVKGSAGRLVQLVQVELCRLGVFQGEIDGGFSSDMEEAVLLWQKSNDLVATGQIRQEELELLGINNILKP